MSDSRFSENTNNNFNNLDPENPKKEHTGLWIPVEIEESGLAPLEIMLWAYIHSYDGQYGCYASNAHFSKRLNTSERNVQLMLQALKKRGLVYQESFDGRKRFLRCSLKSFQRNLVKKRFDTYEKFCTPGMQNSSPLGCTTVHPYIKEERKDNIKKTKAKKEPPDPPPDLKKTGGKPPLVSEETHILFEEIKKRLESMRLSHGISPHPLKKTPKAIEKLEKLRKSLGSNRVLEVITVACKKPFWLGNCDSLNKICSNFHRMETVLIEKNNYPKDKKNEKVSTPDWKQIRERYSSSD